ncbi:MAG TPA: TAT-variant-translocated molybdopterin oxidoreductase [Ardenticatenaceae bacterium]|jgi:molybdopterin-containing oxidoreductase family iron-sulfur binding subunit
MISKKSLDLAATRAQLKASRGKQYWRSLNELADTDEFADWMYNEFPRQAAALPSAVTRRQFLKLMSASLALAGLTGCNGVGQRDQERIVPYVEAPERIIPGKPLFFATAMELGGIATGLLVESHMGRPTKVEGNPDHPSSVGATDVFSQASVLTLYDPDRAEAVTSEGRIRTWDDFLGALGDALAPVRDAGGAGLHILTETVGSPTLGAQLTALLDALPGATWHQYAPVGRDNARAGAQAAFGEDVNTVYQFGEANVVLSLDADFLSCSPGSLRYTRDFADRRRVRAADNDMNRLYVVESSYSTTGSKADHRLPLRASEIEGFARALASELGVEGVAGGELPETVSATWLTALADDLRANEGASIVIPGDGQTPAVHALAHAINAALGNVGSTLYYTQPLDTNPGEQAGSLTPLVDALNGGAVEVLIIVGGNPVYTAPADLNFAEALRNAGFSAHLSLYQDETAQVAGWHIPQTHFLETWSDARAFDGTVTIMQPLIAPLYQGRSAHELLAALAGDLSGDPYEIVRATWQEQLPTEAVWRAALHNGVMEGSEFEPLSVTLADDWDAGPSPALDPSELEIVFRDDPTIYDGQFANNGWLQELPKPISSLTWDNAAFVSPATAEQLGLRTEELVELQYLGRSVLAPILVLPGHADNSVTVTLGYGRTSAGQVGEGIGFNAYALRTSDAPWFGGGVEIVKTGREYDLALVQGHFRLNGRDELVHATTLAEFRENPDEFGTEEGTVHEEGVPGQEERPAEEEEHELPSLYPEYEYNGYAWGMVIDLTTCVGCNACVIACQAENNIAVVGKEEVARSREMHWLVVDTYYTGDAGNPSAIHMPRPCMHCEKAPCEPVCPVAATVHDSEGLNNMIYNRCVGTRYCSNNCPYKVRRFNFLEYADETPVLDLLRNPDVTVRSRGVMEKCTYCVQRINVARIEADKEGRRIRDGEVVTACAAACPTRAIIFGDINDPDAEVTRLKQSPLDYGLLAELGTQPRTTYLAAIHNPNPALAGEESA